MNNATTQSHIVWLDVIRTVAMLMVIGVHCIDPFYISPTLGSLPEYKHWAAVYGSLLRPSVPLFVMMTGLLLLPIEGQLDTPMVNMLEQKLEKSRFTRR